MQVVDLRTIAGPSIFNHEPVVIMTLDLEDLAERPSTSLPGLTETLIRLLPGLGDHVCSRGKPGGFVERLHEGTYPAHICEHMAIELSQRAGLPVNFGKTVSAGPPGRYEVVVRFVSEEAMKRLLRAAVRLFEGVVAGAADAELTALRDAAVEDARRTAAREELGPTTKALVRAAERRGVPWTRVGDGSLIQLGHGARLKYIQASISGETRSVAVDISCDKELTKTLLRRADVPVPRGAVVRTAEEAVAAVADLACPVAIKPIDGHHGEGVSLRVTTPEDATEAFRLASAFSSQVLVEEFFEGRDYRVLVVGGRLIAAAERVPAHVVGDGERTIEQLIEAVNAQPGRGEGHAAALTKITIDEVALRGLRRRGLEPTSVPAAGDVVFVRETANLSTGGTARDVTDHVHPAVRVLCERAARVIGLDVAGIDLVVPDITAAPTRGGIIEVNAAPGLRMHHHPTEGTPRDAGGAIIDMLFPPGATGRIPIAAVTGTNGKTTTARIAAHALASTGKVVGLTTSAGVYIGGERVITGDCSGPRSARALLSDPAVEVAVLETARGGIMRGGLAYDWSDVGAITNIQPDHLGQNGIESLEDLLHVKSLVAERVRQGGTIVLNADDTILTRLTEQPRLQRLRRDLAWVTLDPELPLVRRHLAGGGRGYLLRDGWLVEVVGGREERVLQASDVGVSYEGTAEFQLQNALFALAIARALGAPTAEVARGLATFEAPRDNAGRANLYQVRGASVLVDYGHNPEAFRAVARMVSRWSVRRTTGVVSVPGDRNDALVSECGRVLGRAFDRLVVKEDEDRRGRHKGQVAALVRAAALRAAPGREVKVVLDEAAAVETALRDARDGDLVVVFYERLDVVQAVLRAWNAQPVTYAPRRRGAA